MFLDTNSSSQPHQPAWVLEPLLVLKETWKSRQPVCLGPSPIQELPGKMGVCGELPSDVASPWLHAYLGHSCPIYLDNIPVR